MSSLAVTNTFVANTTILSADVNTNFNDIVSYINNRNSASAAWDQLSVAGNGTIVGTLTLTGGASLSSTLSVGTTSTFTGVATFTAAPIFSALTATTVPYLNGSKILTSSAVTPTELGYLSGVTSAVQTQIGTLFPKAGVTDASSASAGNVGEFVISTVSTFGSMASTGTYGNITSITLTAGDWDIMGQAFFNMNGATSSSGFDTAISENSGNTTTDHVDGLNVIASTASALGRHAGATVNYRVTTSGSKTYYLKTRLSYSGGPSQALGTISARRRR